MAAVRAMLDVPALVERVGAYLSLADRRACVLAHRDLAPAMHLDSHGAWTLRPGADYAAKGAALRSLKPRLRSLTLTLDRGSGDDACLTAAAAVLHFATHAGLASVGIVENGRHPASAARLLAVLAVLRPLGAVVRVERAEGLWLSDALRVLEAAPGDVGDLQVHDERLGAGQLALWRRLVDRGRTAEVVRFHDDFYDHATSGDAEASRLLRASARSLDLRSGAAASALARVADAVSYEKKLAQDPMSLALLENLRANRELQTLALAGFDVHEAVVVTPFLEVVGSLASLRKVYLCDQAAENVGLPTLLHSLLAETACEVAVVVATAEQRVVASRAVRAVAAAFIVGRGVRDNKSSRLSITDLGFPDSSSATAAAVAAEAELAASAEPRHRRLREGACCPL